MMKIFLKDKKTWGYVFGTIDKLAIEKVNYATLLDNYEVDSLKIITLINNSIEYLIDTQLAKYNITKEVWEHLARLYTQSNFTKQYQLKSYT